MATWNSAAQVTQVDIRAIQQPANLAPALPKQMAKEHFIRSAHRWSAATPHNNRF
jgi:hypothetical protein